MTTDPWQLDPDRFPKRVDIEVSDEAYELLTELSQRSGRSISEIAAAILEEYATPHKEQDS